MKITIRDLKYREACVDGVDWFKDNFGTEANVWDVVKKLEEIKDSRGWIGWLFRQYNLTGLYKCWHKNGNIRYEYNCKKGKDHGLCKGWYKNGGLKYEYNCKNGLKHGLCKGWHDNGNLEYEYNCKDGKSHGLCKGWYYNGELQYEENYDKGVLI